MKMLKRLKRYLGAWVCKFMGHNFCKAHYEHEYLDLTCGRCGESWRL